MFHYYYALLKILATKSTSGRTPRGLILDKSTKWTDPKRVKYLTSPQSEQTLRGLITWQVHKVDES